MSNPYAVSEADPSIENENRAVSSFKRKSVLLVILLSIVTFGVYPFYWVVTRTKILNQLIPEKAIPSGFTLTVTIAYIVLFAGGFIAGFTGNEGLVQTLNLLNLPIYILLVVWFFKFANRLESVSKSPYSGVGVFFLSAFYLQHKINKLIDAETAA